MSFTIIEWVHIVDDYVGRYSQIIYPELGTETQFGPYLVGCSDS